MGLEVLAVRAHRKELELAFHIAPDVPDRLIGDPGRLRQIIINLVGNALKFTESGGVRVVASLPQPDEENPQLRFRVIDSGIGMTAEALSRVFEEFQQAESTTSRDYGGTGLGLPISKQLAHLLGGDLVATSVAGEGSTFTLSIPMRLD